MPKIDLTGKEFKYFKVLNRNLERKGKNVWWNCECHCGKIFIATTTEINKGTRKSCGCMKAELLSKAHLQDLVGQTFGELKVLERDFDHPQNGKKVRTYWKCQCSCGNIVSVERTHLVNRYQSSCGCKQSIGELNINKMLSSNNITYITQYTNSDLKTDKGGYLRFDFALINNQQQIYRLIEFDGPQHQKEDKFFNNFEEIQQRDNVKNKYAKEQNIPLVRIPYYKRDNLTIQDLLEDRFVV